MSELTGRLPSPPTRTLTGRELAARLGISYGALRVRASRGQLPPSKLVDGRRVYPITDVDRWENR